MTATVLTLPLRPSEPEPKHVMDAAGNWKRVMVVRTRVGKGWREQTVGEAS